MGNIPHTWYRQCQTPSNHLICTQPKGALAVKKTLLKGTFPGGAVRSAVHRSGSEKKCLFDEKGYVLPLGLYGSILLFGKRVALNLGLVAGGGGGGGGARRREECRICHYLS